MYALGRSLKLLIIWVIRLYLNLAAPPNRRLVLPRTTVHALRRKVDAEELGYADEFAFRPDIIFG